MLIDSSVRDAVLLPLLLFVGITAVLRSTLFRLLASKATPAETELKQRGVVTRSQRLRAHGGFITPGGFATRMASLVGVGGSGGALREEVKDGGGNPMSQMDTMKTQIVNQAVYFGLFYAIQNALAGFLVVKIPFALTERFKQLTQQGIGVPALDTSFVSSGSWYMIAQYGISRVIELFGAGNALVDDSRMMQMQMGMMPGMGAPSQAWMAKTAYAGEVSALGVTTYNSALLQSERDMLKLAQRLGK